MFVGGGGGGVCVYACGPRTEVRVRHYALEAVLGDERHRLVQAGEGARGARRAPDEHVRAGEVVQQARGAEAEEGGDSDVEDAAGAIVGLLEGEVADQAAQERLELSDVLQDALGAQAVELALQRALLDSIEHVEGDTLRLEVARQLLQLVLAYR